MYAASRETHKIRTSDGSVQLIDVSPRPEQSTQSSPHAVHASPLQDDDSNVEFESAVGEAPEPPPEAAAC